MPKEYIKQIIGALVGLIGGLVAHGRAQVSALVDCPIKSDTDTRQSGISLCSRPVFASGGQMLLFGTKRRKNHKTENVRRERDGQIGGARCGHEAAV